MFTLHSEDTTASALYVVVWESEYIRNPANLSLSTLQCLDVPPKRVILHERHHQTLERQSQLVAP